MPEGLAEAGPEGASACGRAGLRRCVTLNSVGVATF
jgi:hypothetical protein